MLCLLALMALASGCMTIRTTTTARTALEQALLSQAAEVSIQNLKFEGSAAKSFFIKKDYFNAVDGEYILGLLNRRLLEIGLPAANEEKEADLIIYPSIAHAGIDDSSFLIGLPAIPLCLPGAGGVTVPETAFFKHTSQRSSNRMFVVGKDAKSKKQLFASDTVTGQRYHERWTFFFVFNFTSTDLKETH